MVHIPFSTYQIYNIKFPDKLEFIGLTAAKNIRNKVLFFLFFPWKERTKGTSRKTTIAKRQKSRKAKSTEMNLLISVLFTFGTRHRRCRRGIYLNPSASFALQTSATPITRKFLGCRGIFSKIPRIFLTDKLKFK